ncbi:MAG: thioredoxin family protein [Candidatus Marsarchaeota archaeon]|nr:thioredoxin family protein [Candidatus Marsarchaeota archaeon]
MGLLKDSDKKTVSELFSKNLEGEVNLMLFYDSPSKCELCEQTRGLVKEVAALNAKIKVTEYDINSAQKEAKFLGVDKTPALVVGGKKLYNVVYYGIPAGYEFSSLLDDMIDASKGVTRLSPATKERLKEVKTPVEIKVFVTPTCPYCPKAVRTAHQFAMENSMIKGHMIEATEFMELAQHYGVMGVPKVVINDSVSFEGAYPEDAFLEYVLQAAKA